MHRIICACLLLAATTTGAAAADRRWETGKWGDITTKRRMVDFGPGASGFGRPGATPAMRAMADVRRLIIETGAGQLEIEDTVPVGRRSVEAEIGAPVTFAVEKNAVYIRSADGTEHKLRLIRKVDRATPAAASADRKPTYTALGGGHVVRSIADGGRSLTLEDGSRWDISPRDQYLTVNWEASANVTVRTLPRAENGFLYEIINTGSDEGAVANPVSAR